MLAASSVNIKLCIFHFSRLNSRLVGAAAHLPNRAGWCRKIWTVVRAKAVSRRSFQVAVLKNLPKVSVSSQASKFVALKRVINLPDWSFGVLDRQSVECMANGVARKDCDGGSERLHIEPSRMSDNFFQFRSEHKHRCGLHKGPKTWISSQISSKRATYI